jgi:hypothetical protein
MSLELFNKQVWIYGFMDFARLEHVDLQPREMGYHYHSIGI